MREPVDARDLLGIELHFLMDRPADRMLHTALDASPQGFGINDQSAVVAAGEPLDPDMTGLAVDFNLGNHGGDSLAAERVSNTTACENVALADRLWRRTRIPAECFLRRFHRCDGTR